MAKPQEGAPGKPCGRDEPQDSGFICFPAHCSDLLFAEQLHGKPEDAVSGCKPNATEEREGHSATGCTVASRRAHAQHSGACAVATHAHLTTARGQQDGRAHVCLEVGWAEGLDLSCPWWK